MSSNANNGLKRIELLYLNSDGADVWFVFKDERIPAHKLILTTMSPWLNTMFFGALPEGNEVNMTNGPVTADAFKEFLQFFYTDKVKLTLKNIESVMDLAKQSLADHIFAECEEFLAKSITTDTMCFGYQLALRYGASKLKKICEDEICVNAEQVLRSSSFMEFPYEFLEEILQCDSLACEEKDVFNACIAWAKAACKRNGKDPLKMENLRAQLKDTVHQIRFISMTKEEVARCIASCPGFFTANELEEIICMTGKATANTIKKCDEKFNWTPRYFNLRWDKGRRLECERFWFRSKSRPFYPVQEVETTSFTCNRRVLLRGFECECNEIISKAATIEIIEKRSKDDDHDPIERYNEETTLNFENKVTYYSNKLGYLKSYVAKFTLNKPILLRPKYTYVIKITLTPDEEGESEDAPGEQEESEDAEQVEKAEIKKAPFRNDNVYKPKVLLNFDISIRFNSARGIISSLSLSRFDNKNLIQKLIHSPLAWF